MKRTKLVGILSIALFLIFSGCNWVNPKKEAPTLVKVRFGMLPYGDHTYAIIGLQKGWFKDVGIDLIYEPLKVEEIVPALKNKTMDVVSCPPGIIFSSYDII